MKNLKDTRSKIIPSTTRGGKELPSSSALDSPSLLSQLATPRPIIQSDMSQVIDDATSKMNETIDDTASMPETDIPPLGDFLAAQIALAKQSEIDEIAESPVTPRSPAMITMPKIPEGHLLDGDIAREILACKDSEDLKK